MTILLYVLGALPTMVIFEHVFEDTTDHNLPTIILFGLFWPVVVSYYTLLLTFYAFLKWKNA